MVTETRDFLARELASLEHGRALGDLDLYAIYGDFRHWSLSFSLRKCWN
jgi:hypothetical protein